MCAVIWHPFGHGTQKDPPGAAGSDPSPSDMTCPVAGLMLGDTQRDRHRIRRHRGIGEQ